MSIKNKLVTAVTTAGLLAGLFGSAFVPAARAAAALTAADNSSTLRCVASTTDADVEVRGDAGGTCYAAAGSTVTVDVVINGGTEEVGDWFSVILDGSAGATIVGHTADGEVSGFNIVNSGNTVYMGLIAAAADELEFRVQVKAPASGSSYTYTLYDSAAPTTELESLVIVGAGAGTANVPSTATSKLSKPCYAFVTLNAGAGTDGVAVSETNDVVADTDQADPTADTTNNDFLAVGGSTCADSLVPAVAAGDNYVLQIQILDAFGNAVTSDINGQIRATVSGPAGVALSDTYTNPSTNCAADEAKSAVLGHTDGHDYVCLLGDGDSGVATLTVTSGSVTFTRQVVFRGAIDSITISGPSYMSSDVTGSLRFNDALTVTCKDDAGQVFGDGGADFDGETEAEYIDGDMTGCNAAALSFEVLDGNGASVGSFSDVGTGARVTTRAGSTFYDSSVGGADFAATDSEALNGKWDIPGAICADGDEGETRKITVSAGLLDSNTLTMTCVTPYVKLTGVTALNTGTSGSATSGKNGQTIKVRVDATDGEGRPAGLGSEFVLTTTPSWTTAGTATAKFAAGSATLTITLPSNSGMQYVIYSAADGNDYTLVSEAFAQKISFTVTNDADALTALSISKGPKGRVVTASGFNAGELVKFEVENALTGVVRTYNRKANASGVATWRNATAALKYVTAIDSDDNLTDTISVKRK